MNGHVYRFLVRLTGQRGDGTPIAWSEIVVAREPLTDEQVRARVVWALEVEHRTRLGVRTFQVRPADPRPRVAAAGAADERIGAAA